MYHLLCYLSLKVWKAFKSNFNTLNTLRCQIKNLVKISTFQSLVTNKQIIIFLGM